MRARLYAPLPGGMPQALASRNRRIDGGWIGGMQVDRCANGLRAFPERIKDRVIEVLSVGVTIDQGTAKTEVADTPLQFVGGCCRVLHREMRKAGIAVRAVLDLARQHVVCLASLAASDVS